MLSGGERQRIAIGRALLASPDLLLMDEPLNALDNGSKSETTAYFDRMKPDRPLPVIYVSHSPAEIARLADRIVMIDNGKTAFGTGICRQKRYCRDHTASVPPVTHRP